MEQRINYRLEKIKIYKVLPKRKYKTMTNIAIIGSGSWGVALAVYLANQGKKVKIWSFAKEEADLINNEKKCKFLPNIILPEGI